jgi:hypothetical protein
MNIPNFIFESLVSVFWVKDTVLKFFDAVPDPGSEILSTVDPGWKIADPGPGMFF